MRRYATSGAPIVAVLVVGLALFTLATPRALRGARVFGGPVDASRALSFRVEAFEERGGLRRALVGGRALVDVRAAGRWGSSLELLLDRDGAGYGELPPIGAPGPDPVAITVRLNDEVIAEGHVRVTREQWRARARERGGWITPKQLGSMPVDTRGGLSVRFAPARGVMAVPFVDAVLVEVTGAAGPIAGAGLALEPDDVEVLTRAPATDENGLAEVALRPRAHVAALRVTAQSADGALGSAYGTLPILEGAIDARQLGGMLHIASPVERERAYFAVITRDAQIASGAVDLAPDGRGGAVGSTELPELPRSPTWVVVSSELDFTSPGTVGWPLSDAPDREHIGSGRSAPRALAIPPCLWLDGVSPLRSRAERRAGRVRQLAAAIVSAAALLVALSVFVRARGARLALARHIAVTLGEREASPKQGSQRESTDLAVAVITILLGFLLLATFVLLVVR